MNSFTDSEFALLNHDDVTRLLDTTGDPIRLEIIFLLGHGERQNVSEITSHFRLSRPAISHHLKVLKDAGVVQSEKIGQEVYYWLDSKRVVAGLRALADKIERSYSPYVPSE